MIPLTAATDSATRRAGEGNAMFAEIPSTADGPDVPSWEDSR